MSDFRPPPDGTDLIKPSWVQNGFLALGCLILAFGLFRLDPDKVEGSLYMSIFMVFGAVVLMSSHLPGSTGVWLDRDGFLVREMYKSERYRWDEVGPFIVRRKLLGKSIEFPYTPAGEELPKVRSLPRAIGASAWSVAQKMNDWRAWAADEAG